MRIRTIAFAFVYFSIVHSYSAAEAFTWTPAKDAEATAGLNNYLASHSVPAMSVSITINGNPVYARGFGTVAGGPVTAQTLFAIGSVTKQFTAAGILALIEENKRVPFDGSTISLKSPVDSFFANVEHWSMGSPNNIHRLLTMTSNIPSYTDDAAWWGMAVNAPIPAVNMMPRIKSYPLAGPLGAYHYSNTNYFLLAQTIQIVAGADLPNGPNYYEQYMRSRILNRAGMSASVFIGGALAGAPIAMPNGGFGSPPTFTQPDWPKGAGNLASSADDMARWNKALFGGKVINASSLKTMLAPVATVGTPPYSGCSYAMGWFVCPVPGLTIYQHDGVIAGFTATNLVARKASGEIASVTILTNRDGLSDLSVLARQILSLVNR